MIPSVRVGQKIWVKDMDDHARVGTVISLRDDWIGWATVVRDRPYPDWLPTFYNCPTTCILGLADA